MKIGRVLWGLLSPERDSKTCFRPVESILTYDLHASCAGEHVSIYIRLERSELQLVAGKLQQIISSCALRPQIDGRASLWKQWLDHAFYLNVEDTRL